MREERKVVTALFADLQGSTALGEQLDAEDVKLIVGEAVARIVHAVEDYGGTVKDLAGDGVLALFGAPAAHEDDPERAVRAGLRIAHEIAAYGQEVAQAWGTDGLAVRVGINTGPVALGPIGAGARVEYAAFGDTVNTAARLQSAADPGGVLVGADTKRLIDPRFEWREAQRLELKGKASAVEAFTAVRAIADVARQRGLAGLQTRLIGRERELAQAREAVEGALRGAGGILLLLGEAGIGKSRLLGELHEVGASGADATHPPQWLEGRCVSYGESLPYWPFRDLVRRWLGVSVDEPELRTRVALRRRLEPLFGERTAEIYPYLGALLDLSLEPDAQSKLAELSPEALQYRTFEVVATLVARLAEDGPVLLVLEDLHWADSTSLQLVERLLPVTQDAGVLLVLVMRIERDHASWGVRDLAARDFPHRMTEVILDALSGNAGGDLLDALVGGDTLPDELRARILAGAEGNPFFLEELVRSLVDAGALVSSGEKWRFDHDAEIDLPPTVEQVIVARIDRLPDTSRDVLVAASVLGRHFGVPLLEGVSGGNGATRQALHELERLDLVREERRWPQPEYRFKHALIQEGAYRSMLAADRTRLHRRAAEWLEERHSGSEEEVFGLLAHHWLAARDEDKAIEYLLRAGDKARQEYAIDEAVEHYRALLPLLEERGQAQDAALVLFKLALALHTSLRFEQANNAYQRAFALWTPPAAHPNPTAELRIATSFLPNDADPKSAIAWPNIQLCMQLFDRLVEAWPERTLVPSLAERWEIAADGLRYVFHLGDGLRWSDGESLTAHDVEYGIKRVLDPKSPGSSVAIYFVLENGQDYYLGLERNASKIGVRALDDATVEFKLSAPAPYFMNVMNRPDGGPQPRHAIEAYGERWTEPELQIVSGSFRQAEQSEDSLALTRRADAATQRTGNVSRIEFVRLPTAESLHRFRHGELDLVAVRYTPLLADVVPTAGVEASLGPAGWTAYLSFDHNHAVTSNVEFRRALAHAIDRDALAAVAPSNLVVASGGLVPPALQGHTPEIVPRFDPDVARDHLVRADVNATEVAVAALEDFEPLLGSIARSWREVLGIDVAVKLWTRKDVGQLVKFEGAPIVLAGWLPGYQDPEYYLRLLLQSTSRTNEGGFADPAFDILIERARQERSDRERLALFHEADRYAVADRVALIPLVYGRSMAFVKPRVHGWWEFGKTSASFADLRVDE